MRSRYHQVNLSAHKLLSLMLPGGSNSQLAGVEMTSVASNKITVFAIGTVSSDNHLYKMFVFFFFYSKGQKQQVKYNSSLRSVRTSLLARETS